MTLLVRSNSIDACFIDAPSLISNRYPLDQIESALRKATEGDQIKLVIDIS